MNTIERVRLKVGLTKPQMLRVIEAKAGRITLFSTREETIDPAFLLKARQVEEKYDRWVEQVLHKLRYAADATPDGLLRTRDVARILGISDFHLSQIRIRGNVEATADKPRRFLYTYDAVADLVRSNSEVLTSEDRKSRGPLTNGFLAWAADPDRSREARELSLASA